MSVSDQLDAPATAARDGDVRAEEAPRGESKVTSAYVTIAKPAQELYDFWRDFSNLPQVMENIEAIETQGESIAKGIQNLLHIMAGNFYNFPAK